MGYMANIGHQKDSIPGFVNWVEGSNGGGTLMTQTKNYHYRWILQPNMNNCGAMYAYGMSPSPKNDHIHDSTENKKEIAQHYNELCKQLGKITSFWTIQFSYSAPQERLKLALLPEYLENAVFVKGRSNDRSEYSTFVTVTTEIKKNG